MYYREDVLFYQNFFNAHISGATRCKCRHTISSRPACLPGAITLPLWCPAVNGFLSGWRRVGAAPEAGVGAAQNVELRGPRCAIAELFVFHFNLLTKLSNLLQRRTLAVQERLAPRKLFYF